MPGIRQGMRESPERVQIKAFIWTLSPMLKGLRAGVNVVVLECSNIVAFQYNNISWNRDNSLYMPGALTAKLPSLGLDPPRLHLTFCFWKAFYLVVFERWLSM
jgi:hypothetical protein